jgi:hypothetical protein
MEEQEALTERQTKQVNTLLQEDLSLRRAYELKERLRHWYQLTNLEQATTEFPNLIQAMLSSDVPEYKTLANTMLAWRSEILAETAFCRISKFSSQQTSILPLMPHHNICTRAKKKNPMTPVTGFFVLTY